MAPFRPSFFSRFVEIIQIEGFLPAFACYNYFYWLEIGFSLQTILIRGIYYDYSIH